MPSERSLYIERNRRPAIPLEMDEFRNLLPSLGVKRLAEIIWTRAQEDDVLSKALMASICLRAANGDWEKAKSAIDYALHFPDYVRYIEGGHGLIIDEITSALQALSERGNGEFAIRIARFAAERAQEVAENFEDDWDWTSSLDGLTKWIANSQSAGGSK